MIDLSQKLLNNLAIIGFRGLLRFIKFQKVIRNFVLYFELIRWQSIHIFPFNCKMEVVFPISHIYKRCFLKVNHFCHLDIIKYNKILKTFEIMNLKLLFEILMIILFSNRRIKNYVKTKHTKSFI